MKRAAVMMLLALAAALPARAESPLVPAVWCAAKSSAGPGCDVGAAVALAHRGRWALVGVVGSKTAGAGVAFTAYEPTAEFAHRIAVAAGVVARYDSKGISTRAYPALGVTLSWGKEPPK